MHRTDHYTIRQRRIKCDEKRPECTQCVRSGKICTGYPPPSRGSRPPMEIRIAPKPLLTMQVAPSSVSATLTPTVGISMIQKHTILPPRRAGRRRKAPDALTVLAARATPLMVQPASTLHLKPTEGVYFELFRIQTASQLSGYFNSNFWTQRVLQECHSESAIRHSVVALGALYRTLELSFESPSTNMTITQQHADAVLAHWQVAIKQYSDACNAMLTVKDDNVGGYHTRLIAIILLACFDSFIGDHKQAIVQIQSGLGLLGQFQTRRRSISSTPTNSSDDELVVLFNRLAIQAKSYDLAFHFPEPYIIKLGSAVPDPDSPPTGGSDRSSPSSAGSPPREGVFESLAEARLASDRLCLALLLFVERLYTAKTDPSYVLPSSWKKYGMGLKERLAAWSEAFEPILASRLLPDTSHIEKSGIAALKMFQTNAHIIFLMLFCDNELQFDAFMPHFKLIVDLGWEVVGADEMRYAMGCCSPECLPQYPAFAKATLPPGTYRPGGLKPSFSADLGIVAPLYVVATKCREPFLRRQAIQLLKSSARREGMWDSGLASNIATWVMQIEEQGVEGGGGAAVPAALDPRNPMAGYPDCEGIMQRTIPDERRIMVKAADFDLRARYADITVGTRAVHNGSLDVRSKKTRITW